MKFGRSSTQSSVLGVGFLVALFFVFFNSQAQAGFIQFCDGDENIGVGLWALNAGAPYNMDRTDDGEVFQPVLWGEVFSGTVTHYPSAGVGVQTANGEWPYAETYAGNEISYGLESEPLATAEDFYFYFEEDGLGCQMDLRFTIGPENPVEVWLHSNLNTNVMITGTTGHWKSSGVFEAENIPMSLTASIAVPYTVGYKDTYTVTGQFQNCYGLDIQIDETQTGNPGDTLNFNLNYFDDGSCEPPDVDIKFNGSDGPVAINNGDSGTLSWDVSGSSDGMNCNATSSEGDWTGGKSWPNGSEGVGPLTTPPSSRTYTLDCSNNYGSDSDTVTVNINAVAEPVVDLTINWSDGPLTEASGFVGDIRWTVSGGQTDFCEASNNAGDTNWDSDEDPSNLGGGPINTGSVTTSRTYSIYCEGPGGSDTDSVTVNIALPPTVDLKIAGSDGPLVVPSGFQDFIIWTISGGSATSCTASNTAADGNWIGPKSTTGGGPVLHGVLVVSITYTLDCVGPGGLGTDSVVITVLPPPPPTVTLTVAGSGGPLVVPVGFQDYIVWTISGGSATSCTASNTAADGNWIGPKSTTGGGPVLHGVLVVDITYTLDCVGPGGNGSDSVVITVFTPPPTVSNVTVAPGNYCTSTGRTISWSYTDNGGGPQTMYQVQIDNDFPGFGSPEWDSGQVSNPGTSVATGNCNPGNPPGTGPGTCRLDFGQTYQARVRVWDSIPTASNWTVSAQFSTPPYAYPQPNFTYDPLSPSVGAPVDFTDTTIFSGPPDTWFWNFNYPPINGTPPIPISSPTQNPIDVVFGAGDYNISLTATDTAGQSCSIVAPLTAQKQIPVWKEVLPR